MATAAERVQTLREEIASVEAKLNAGVASTSSDAVATVFVTPDDLRRRLAELKGELAAAYGKPRRSRYVQRWDLSGGTCR